MWFIFAQVNGVLVSKVVPDSPNRVAPNRIAILITIAVTHRSNRRYRTFSGLAEREKQG